QRARGIVETDGAALDAGGDRSGNSLRVDLEADRQGGLRRNPATDAAVLLSGDGLVELERGAEVVLATQRIVAEDVASLRDHPLRVLVDLRRLAGGRARRASLGIRFLHAGSCTRRGWRPRRGRGDSAGDLRKMRAK